MASMQEYRLKKETQDIGRAIYLKMVEKECESLDIEYPIWDFEMAQGQSFDSEPNHEAEERALMNMYFNEASMIWKLMEKKGIHANLERIAREIIDTTKLNIEDISYKFFKNLMKVYFPEIKTKDIMQIMFIVVKVASFGIMAYLKNLNYLSIAICKFIWNEMCPKVNEMGGWQVLLSQTIERFAPKRQPLPMKEPMAVAEYSSTSDPSKAQGCQTVRDYSTPVMIAGILGAIGIGAICIGKAIVNSKRNNN